VLKFLFWSGCFVACILAMMLLIAALPIILIIYMSIFFIFAL